MLHIESKMNKIIFSLFYVIFSLIYIDEIVFDACFNYVHNTG